MSGAQKEISNATMSFVDVRDVVDAHIGALERADAAGRYLCVAEAHHWETVAAAIKRLRPAAPVPTAVASGKRQAPAQFSQDRARELGVKFRSLEDMLGETIASLERARLLPTPRL